MKNAALRIVQMEDTAARDAESQPGDGFTSGASHDTSLYTSVGAVSLPLFIGSWLATRDASCDAALFSDLLSERVVFRL